MPYKNIIFIKLFLSLLDEDERFLYRLNDRQQLLYIKILWLAGRTRNQIPKDAEFIIDKIRYLFGKETLFEDMAILQKHYQHLKCSDLGYFFENFDYLHNWTDEGNPKEIQRKSKGNPKDSQEEDKNKIRIEEDKKTQHPFLTNNAFKTVFNDYLDMRRRIKRVATIRAQELILKDLAKYSIDTAILMLQKSLKNSWIGVFPLKDGEEGGNWKAEGGKL